jgi:hypothetical protein
MTIEHRRAQFSSPIQLAVLLASGRFASSRMEPLRSNACSSSPKLARSASAHFFSTAYSIQPPKLAQRWSASTRPDSCRQRTGSIGPAASSSASRMKELRFLSTFMSTGFSSSDASSPPRCPQRSTTAAAPLRSSPAPSSLCCPRGSPKGHDRRGCPAVSARRLLHLTHGGRRRLLDTAHHDGSWCGDWEENGCRQRQNLPRYGRP